ARPTPGGWPTTSARPARRRRWPGPSATPWPPRAGGAGRRTPPSPAGGAREGVRFAKRNPCSRRTVGRKRLPFGKRSMRRAIITVGLGFGDEGKGAVVDDRVRRYEAGLVVRYCGGSQAGHNVQRPDGRRHTFSQFGAGTLAPHRPRTYLGPNVV